MKKMIKGIILDWAGTTIDFGSFAPVAAFMEAFRSFGITPTIEEIRIPMGMQKRAHIEAMLSGKRLSALWVEKFGHPHTIEDIDRIYARFEPALFKVLHNYTRPLPGVISTTAKIRRMGIRIGSTTGYTTEMMAVVAPASAARGYNPDCIVCPDEVGGIGRPYPYMLWRNLEKMGITSIEEVVKAGDTAADMEEGKNAGCISVGIVMGSNMLGLCEAEYGSLTASDLAALSERTRSRFFDAGADYVIEDITGLPTLLTTLNQ
ncbi:MAG: phosphonoacetaldehyde hydrolase [Flexilinea sp.]